MTELTKEQIRKGLKIIILMNVEVNALGDIVFKVDGLDNVWAYLHSQGVVIKVGGISEDLAQTASQPETYYADKVGMSWERDNHIFKAFKQAGYVAVEPLLKED